MAKNKVMNLVIPILSIVLAFIIGMLIILSLGANPLQAISYLFIGAFGTVTNVSNTVVRAMIFAPGNQYSDAVKQVAADYPNVHFAVLNGGEDLPTANIVSILPDANQIGAIAGIIAGTMSKTSVIGFIGGMELDTTKAKLSNFESAAKAINPNIKVVSAYAGSFNDTAKGWRSRNPSTQDGRRQIRGAPD